MARRLARFVFNGVFVVNGTAVGEIPRPELEPLIRDISVKSGIM
jgi:hypothetical protein